MDDYMTAAEVAAQLRTPVETVRYWRHMGHGPKSFKLGRRVLYSRSDVDAWVESRRGTPLGAATPATTADEKLAAIRKILDS